MMYAYLENTSQVKHWEKNQNNLGNAENPPKKSISEGYGAKVAIRPLSIKISKCCKSNFKSVKMDYLLPTVLKFVLAAFMVYETSIVNSCWEAYRGKNTIWTTESKSDNKKVMFHCPD